MTPPPLFGSAISPSGSGASSSPDHESLDLTVKVWRQESRGATGRFESYDLKGVSVHASFLEMLDV